MLQTPQTVYATKTSDCYHAREDCELFQAGRRIGASGVESVLLPFPIAEVPTDWRPCSHCIR